MNRNLFCAFLVKNLPVYTCGFFQKPTQDTPISYSLILFSSQNELQASTCVVFQKELKTHLLHIHYTLHCVFDCGLIST